MDIIEKINQICKPYMFCHAKISKFNTPVGVYKNIRTFNIPVYEIPNDLKYGEHQDGKGP